MSSNSNPPTTAASPPNTSPTEHVNLRVAYLRSDGNSVAPHSLGAVPVHRTIGELRSQLQQELPEHPQPEEQRLIYQGRALMQNDATLRQALRLEGPVGPLPYTIHIIYQPRHASNDPRPSQQQYMTQPMQPNGPVPQADINGQPLPTDPHVSIQRLEQITAMMQSQLNIVEQQMAAVTQPGQPQIPPNVSTSFQVHGRPTHTTHHTPHGTHHTISGMPNLQAMLGAQQAQRYLAATQGPRDQNTTPADEPERPASRTPTPAPPQAREHNLAPQAVPLTPPVPRPSSAPGQPPPQATAPPRQGQPLRPMGLPPPPSGLFGNPTGSHFPPPFAARQAQPGPTNQQTRVWLASSRNGPEALLFAPGHGYFSSTVPFSRTAPAAAVGITSTTQASTTIPETPALQPTTTQAAQAPTTAPARLAVHQQPRDRPQGQQPRVQDQEQENDLYALVVQRGWLFLRLYMFIFVLSEPGTWRRYFLLAAAVIVCLLPRENPLNTLFAMGRRHLDNLIGPPRPQQGDRARDLQQPRRGQEGNIPVHEPARRAGNEQAAANAEQARTPQSTSRTRPQGAVYTTPEATAERLLQEHRQRNPNVFLDTFWRIEQAIALFIASLIPGVGEGHVAVRVQQRREAELERQEQEQEREEQERRQRELDAESTNTSTGSQSESKDLPASGAVQPMTEKGGNSTAV